MGEADAGLSLSTPAVEPAAYPRRGVAVQRDLVVVDQVEVESRGGLVPTGSLSWPWP